VPADTAAAAASVAAAIVVLVLQAVGLVLKQAADRGLGAVVLGRGLLLKQGLQGCVDLLEGALPLQEHMWAASSSTPHWG
jgi:hypothetical protein